MQSFLLLGQARLPNVIEAVREILPLFIRGVLLLVWLGTGVFGCYFVRRRWADARAPKPGVQNSNAAWDPDLVDMTVIYGVASVLWWFLAGGFEPAVIIRIIASSLASLAIGTLVGFIFTAYSQEKDTFGKVRDWLLGGLTGLGIAEVAGGAEHIRKFLDLFVCENDPCLQGVHAANLLAYGTLGFFALLMLRKTRWNRMFIKEDIEVRKAEEELRKIGTAVPEAVSTRSIGSEEPKPAAEAAVKIREAANQAVRAMAQANVSASDLSPEGRLNLARTQLLAGALREAIGTYEQLVSLRYELEDVVPELADAYWQAKRFTDASKVIEQYRAEVGPEALHLLGYYLLWLPNRLEDAVAFCDAYLRANPRSDATIFNKACALAQLFGLAENEERRAGRRAAVIAALRNAISLNPRWRQRAQELSAVPGDDFYPLREDKEFAAILSDSEKGES